MQHYKSIMCIWVVCACICNSLKAQSNDTLELNIKEAEAILLKENLTILNAYYDTKIADAQILQSKLWVNPYLHWNQDMYSVEKNDYFNYKRQALVQVDQTFSIAGKHTNTVRLAKVNAEVNQLLMVDVTRSLIYELGIQFNNLSAAQQKNAIYLDLINKYTARIQAAEKMLALGAISANELLRLKSELVAIETQRLEVANDLVQAMSELKILLNLNTTVFIKTKPIQKLNSPQLLLNDILNASLSNRPDYKIALKNIQVNETNLKLQRSLAVPDINIGYQPLDRGSNYVRTYHGLVVEFSLPFLNRNSGNIQMAQFNIQKSESLAKQKELEINNQAMAVYQTWSQTQSSLNNYTDTFLNSIELLNTNANYNYAKKNISLLEYIDLQRIYLENKLQYIEIKTLNNLVANQLNFIASKELIKPTY